MGRITPDAPSMSPARCAYCKTYGPLGRCASCGAPNEPATRPTFPANRIVMPARRPDRVWR